jgi:inner membrane transporter RhtA
MEASRETTQAPDLATRVPPHAYFAVSAVFHYLGPSFAVLLFANLGVLGVAWLRIALAALVFAAWRRPWRMLPRMDRRVRLLVLALGLCLAAMNLCFYLAIDRLPLATVASIEFVAVIGVALAGVRSVRNLVALTVTVFGAAVLIGPQWSDDAVGLFFAALNALLFALYIVLGHAAARTGGAEGIDRLAAAMLVAAVAALPIGFAQAMPAFTDPILLLAAIGVGLSSSVIPYVCDQLAMARLPRATFALLLSLLPATAAVIAAIVLRQIPTPVDLAGLALVGAGIGLHRPRA